MKEPDVSGVRLDAAGYVDPQASGTANANYASAPVYAAAVGVGSTNI